MLTALQFGSLYGKERRDDSFNFQNMVEVTIKTRVFATDMELDTVFEV